MKDHVLDLVSRTTVQQGKLNIMREYLQAYILRIMRDEGVFRSTAFLGGTALRFLHGLPRFSEDLGFSRAGEEAQDFVKLLAAIKDQLSAAGYEITLTYNEKKTVQSAFVKFAGLLFEAGMAPMKSQKFSIKIEIDTNPPPGAVVEKTVVNKYFPVTFLSYNIPSLFAGKLHAVMSREYIKGRDYFDLGWYCSRWQDITPNMELLTNALRQTHWPGAMPTESTWRQIIAAIVRRSDWKKVEEDVASFLENPSDLKTFTQENVLSLIEKK